MLQLIVAFTLLGSIGALVGAALFLVFPEAMRRFLLPYLVSYAIGTLLGSAFLCLIFIHAWLAKERQHDLRVVDICDDTQRNVAERSSQSTPIGIIP
jgi:hypothetical protein